MISGIRHPKKKHAWRRSRVPTMRPPVRIARRTLVDLVMDGCAIVAVIRFLVSLFLCPSSTPEELKVPVMEAKSPKACLKYSE